MKRSSMVLLTLVPHDYVRIKGHCSITYLAGSDRISVKYKDGYTIIRSYGEKTLLEVSVCPSDSFVVSNHLV